MATDPFETLLEMTRALHVATPALRAFCPFPDDVTPQPLVPRPLPALALLQAETGLTSVHHAALRDAFVACGPDAHWRDTYRDTDIGQDFMDRFGCYCLIGREGPFFSHQMWAWMVYLPAGFWYPWHQHPGEEIYHVIAGEAEFLRRGAAPLRLGEGQSHEHAANEPHAMRTAQSPVMALVLWRSGLGVAPVWS